LFINPAYYSGIQYVAWNAFAYFFWGLYALFLGYLYYYRKNKIVILFSIFSVIVCAGTNYYLIKNYNIIGAAYANFITYLILFIYTVTGQPGIDSIFHFELPVTGNFMKSYKQSSEKIITTNGNLNTSLHLIL